MWLKPTVADIETRLVSAELSAVRALAQKADKPDPLPSIILNTVREMRGYIGACERNKLGPADTVPEQLLGTALAIIRFRLLNYIPTDVLETDPRRREYDTAIALLRSVAACDFSVEQPEEAGPEKMPTGSGAQLVHRTRLRFGRSSTRNLY
jgi:phage gp36-like protein